MPSGVAELLGHIFYCLQGALSSLWCLQSLSCSELWVWSHPAGGGGGGMVQHGVPEAGQSLPAWVRGFPGMGPCRFGLTLWGWSSHSWLCLASNIQSLDLLASPGDLCVGLC